MRFVEQLARNGAINGALAKDSLGISSLKEYDSFLRSGGFLTKSGEDLIKDPSLDDLQTAIISLNTSDIARLLMRIPTFHAYVELLTTHQRMPDWNPAPFMRRSTPYAYGALAEISTLTIKIPGKGFCMTGARPTVEQFTNDALAAYQGLSRSDQLVLTGSWLEELSFQFGYHPVVTRHMLEVAYERGFIGRYYEGSTIDTRFEDHKLAVLEKDETGNPTVRDYHLYHGDFLHGGRASVRIQIESKSQ